MGDGSPQQGPGADPRGGLGAKSPEARYAYTICNGQTRFCDVFIVYLQARAESATPPYSSKNSSNLCKSHDPLWPREGKQVPTHAHSWLRQWCHPTVPVMHALSDLSDEPIKGRFYEPEIQKVTPCEHFTINRILKTCHGADSKIAYYVCWLGYRSKNMGTGLYV